MTERAKDWRDNVCLSSPMRYGMALNETAGEMYFTVDELCMGAPASAAASMIDGNHMLAVTIDDKGRRTLWAESVIDANEGDDESPDSGPAFTALTNCGLRDFPQLEVVPEADFLAANVCVLPHVEA